MDDSYSYLAGSQDTELVQTVTDHVANNTQTHSYDVLNRLTEWKTSSSVQPQDYQYQYDGNSNRTVGTINGVQTIYAFNAANELTTATPGGGGTATQYSYDGNGNETGNNGGGNPAKAATLTYNAKNQTASVTDQNEQAVPYTYAGEGQAQRVTAGGSVGASYVSSSLGLASRTDGTGTVYYTRDPSGKLVGERTSTGSYYYVFDGYGSVAILVDPPGGDPADTYAYCPSGNTLSSAGTVPNVWQFLALEQDQWDTLYHLGLGYDDPNLGRLVQPLGLGSANYGPLLADSLYC